MQRAKFTSGLCGTLSAVATLLLAISAHAQQAPVATSPLPEDARVTPPTPAVAPPQVAPTTIVIRDEAPRVFRSHYRSPGFAAALSLTPAPVDFGNLYAENVGWAMTYTSVELALMTGMMWLGADHMCHRGGRCGDWSDVETGGMVALATGYVGVKIVSGIHAASAARSLNEAGRIRLIPVVAPTSGGASVGVAASF